MLRRITLIIVLLIVAGGLLITAASSNEKKTKSQEPLTVTVTPSGLDQSVIDATKNRLMNTPNVKSNFKGTRQRILSFELLDTEVKAPGRPAPPDRYRAIIYSYENNRAMKVEGRFDNANVQVTLLTKQPEDFSPEEFDEALAILMRDAYFGTALRNNSLKPYRPMPSLSYADQPQGAVERTVNVGLSPRDGSQKNEIVGINMVSEKIVRFKNGAPKISLAAPTACGLPGAGQSTTGRGTAGQYDLTISQSGTPIWQMTIIRPSASSGTRASAVELRNVDYRGKRLLARAHVPVLNVLYVNNACGPYRDWQYQEGMFVANGTDVAPGIRVCTDQPYTILDTQPGGVGQSDTGNFKGVAIYTNGNETTIVSEMEAGWYRYICEWHFYTDGTIEPRFGFGGVTNSCICNDHNHHVYWRFDFDVAGATPNIVTGPALRSWPYPIQNEMKMTRSLTADNRLNIQNVATGDMYSLISDVKDGIADTYGNADAWVLVRDPNGGELDDGYNSTGGSGTAINLDPFINGQSVQGVDVVVWYGAHFLHTVDDALSHKVGPRLVPVQW